MSSHSTVCLQVWVLSFYREDMCKIVRYYLVLMPTFKWSDDHLWCLTLYFLTQSYVFPSPTWHMTKDNLCVLVTSTTYCIVIHTLLICVSVTYAHWLVPVCDDYLSFKISSSFPCCSVPCVSSCVTGTHWFSMSTHALCMKCHLWNTAWWLKCVSC